MTCNNCGASLESTATTCPVCGTAVAGDAGDAGDAGATGATGGPGASKQPGTPPPAWETPNEAGAAAGGSEAWQAGPQQQYGAAWQTAPAVHPSGLPSDVRGWGIGAHAAAYLAFIGLPIVGPLLVWLIRRDHPFVDHHGKESLNFNLSVALYGLVLGVAAIPVGLLTVGLGLIPIGALGVVLMLVWLVLPVVGCVKASNGEGYRYPMTIRFVR